MFVILGFLAVVIFFPIKILFYPDLPFVPLFTRCVFILLASCLLCLYRVFRGPTAPDRIVAIDILGILIVGFCALLGIPTGRSWYIDIGIAWALQSFIATLALSKYLEGKRFDD
ncbi:MAG: cation:proton antiporter [Candidatus Omnitrophica bacterium]|nr:cation:proton antiporter [Candidatus Omnitrophota bacterium]